MNTLSREVPIDPAHAVLLIVDVQNYCAHPEGAGSRKLDPQQRGYLFGRLRETVLPICRICNPPAAARISKSSTPPLKT